MKKYLSFCFLFLFLAPFARAEPIQWTVASGGNGHWYELTSEIGTWNEANIMAASFEWNGSQGYLVSIMSQEENDFLEEFLNDKGWTQYWIGYTDQEEEGVWEWSSGETGSYSNWDPGEPTNSWEFGEHFADIQMWDGHIGTWNDLPVYNPPIFGGNLIELYGIVEYNPNPVPEPATLLLLMTGLLGITGLRKKIKR